MTDKLVVFKNKEIRRVLHNNEWWFSVADVVEALTDSSDSRQYIKKMRQRDSELNSYWGTICTPLTLKAPDGKMRKTNCANTEGIFRIDRSIPAPEAQDSGPERRQDRR
jgi:prophage antirepressor-like protein